MSIEQEKIELVTLITIFSVPHATIRSRWKAEGGRLCCLVPYGWEPNGTWELRLLQGLNHDGLWPCCCCVVSFCFACLASSSPLVHNSSRNRSLLTPLFLSLLCSLYLARPPSLLFPELGENEEGSGLQLAANELGVQTSSHKYELLRQPIWNF